MFAKTLGENIFKNELKQEQKLGEFIRCLSFAHAANTYGSEGFLEGNKYVLVAVSLTSAAPLDEDLEKTSKAFYFHVYALEGDKSTHNIFRVYIDEIKEFLRAHFNACNFEKIK